MLQLLAVTDAVMISAACFRNVFREEKWNAFHEDRLTLIPVQIKGNSLPVHSWHSLLHNLEAICAFNRLTPVC